MATLANLIVRIGSSADSLEKDLGKIEKKLNKTARNLTNTGKNLTAGLTVPIVAGGAALLGLAHKAGQTADRLLDLEQITGLSTDTLQKMQYVAGQAGVDFEGLANTSTSLQRKLMGIENDTGRAAEAMGRLGIDIHDAEGNLKSMDDLLPQAINKLQGMENTTERNMLAAQLFGGSFQDLAPILGMTADEMDAVMQEAEDLGLVLGKDALNQANDFRVESEKLKAQFSALGMEIGSKLAPMLGDTLFPIIQDKVIPIVERLAERVANVITWFSELDPRLQNVILGVIGFAAALGPMLLGLGMAIKTISSIIGTIKLLIGFVKTITILKKVWTGVQIVLNAVISANPIALIVLAIIPLIAIIVLLVKNWDTVVEALKKGWDWIAGVFVTGWEHFSAFWANLWEGVKNIATNVWDNIVGFFDKARNKIVGVFTKIKDGILGIWDGIFGGIKGFVNKIIGAMNGMINGINKLGFDVPKWVPIIGGKKWGFNLPKIPVLHSGTPYFKPPGGGDEGLALLQRGEAVIPRKHNERVSQPHNAGQSEIHVHLHGGTYIGTVDESVARQLAKLIRPALKQEEVRLGVSG